jgi:hypothetical protein
MLLLNASLIDVPLPPAVVRRGRASSQQYYPQILDDKFAAPKLTGYVSRS